MALASLGTELGQGTDMALMTLKKSVGNALGFNKVAFVHVHLWQQGRRVQEVVHSSSSIPKKIPTNPHLSGRCSKISTNITFTYIPATYQTADFALVSGTSESKCELLESSISNPTSLDGSLIGF